MKHIPVIFAIVLAMPFLGCTESAYKSTAHVSKDSARSGDVASDSSSAKAGSVVFGNKFPEVLAVDAKPNRNGEWRFNVTLSSPYDSPQRYADAWRVLDSEEHELGIRILGHDHANEQPFTRSENIEIPESTSEVFVEGRDQANGWSGQRFKFKIPVSESEG